MHLFRRSRNYPNKFSSVAVIQPSGEMSDNNPGGIISSGAMTGNSTIDSGRLRR